MIRAAAPIDVDYSTKPEKVNMPENSGMHVDDRHDRFALI